MSTVFITDGDRPLGTALRESFTNAGFDVAVHPANGDAKSLAAAISSAGPVELLINNAEPEFDRLAFEEIDENIFVNMMTGVARTAFFAVQAVHPIMQTLGGGKIINVSSSAPVCGMTGGAHFTAAKGSLYSFTRSWANELATDNIRVNLVAADVTTGTAAEDGGGETPLGRPVTIEDVVETITYLAGSGGDMISGQEIIVDGGFTRVGF